MQLLLIEDDALIARELQMRWTAHGWSVQACGTLAEADVAARSGVLRFDLVVLDLGLPDGDGLTWLVRLRQSNRLTPALILTARDGIADRVQGLRSGADDYLVKPFAVEELDARVEGLVRRAIALRGETICFGPLSWLRNEGIAFINDRPLELLRREFEVLGVLLRRAPRLVPKLALVESLSQRNHDVGDSAVEVYVSRLRRKLDGSGVSIRTMRGFGYLLMLESASE